MLKLMEPVPFTVFVQPHKGSYLNIGIKAVNVGIGMVVDVVLYFPVVRTGTHAIEGIRRNLVEPLMAGETLVTTFVHDVKANGSKVDPKQSAHSSGKQRSGGKENKDAYRLMASDT